MSTALRQVGQVRPGDHLCLGFDTDDEQREIVTAFMQAGLAQGEKVVYFTDETAPEMVTGWLRAQNIDADLATARGQLEIRQAADVYVSSGRFDPDVMLTALRTEAAEVKRAGFTALRATGEMSWALRGHPGSELLRSYEQRLHEVYDAGGVTGICQYDRRLFGSAATADLVCLHPLRVEPDPVHDDGALRIMPMFQPSGLRVAGTVDFTTGAGLAMALRDRAARTAGDLHLDLAELAFIDVAGLRTLVEYARGLDGRQLHVANLAPALRRVVALVGWDTAPNLTFDSQAPEAVCA